MRILFSLILISSFVLRSVTNKSAKRERLKQETMSDSCSTSRPLPASGNERLFSGVSCSPPFFHFFLTSSYSTLLHQLVCIISLFQRAAGFNFSCKLSLFFSPIVFLFLIVASFSPNVFCYHHESDDV